MIVCDSEKINKSGDHDSLAKKLPTNDMSKCFILSSKNFIFYTKRSYFLKKIEIQNKKKNPYDKIR